MFLQNRPRASLGSSGWVRGLGHWCIYATEATEALATTGGRGVSTMEAHRHRHQ